MRVAREIIAGFSAILTNHAGFEFGEEMLRYE